MSFVTSLFSSGSSKYESPPAPVVPTSGSFYDIIEKDSKGADVNFGDRFKGKVVYGVNVASQCGYTKSGYELINELCALKKEGLDVEVAMFPCNQFGVPLLGGQEPGSDADIEKFCTGTKGVQGGNLFTKADVNGANSRATYNFLRENKYLDKVKWNFAGKFIVDKEGNLIPIANEKHIIDTIKDLASKSPSTVPVPTPEPKVEGAAASVVTAEGGSAPVVAAAAPVAESY